MYRLNFSSGPSLPSQIPLVNEYLLSNFQPSINDSEEREKTGYSKTQVAAALGLSMITVAGAIWAYNNPDLLKNWSEKIQSNPQNENSPYSGHSTSPSDTTTKTNNFVIRRTRSSSDAEQVSKVDIGQLALPLTFLSSIPLYTTFSSTLSLDELSKTVSDYILGIVQEKCPNTALILSCPRTPIKGDSQTSQDLLTTKVLQNLQAHGVGLESGNSTLTAYALSSNDQKKSFDLLSTIRALKAEKTIRSENSDLSTTTTVDVTSSQPTQSPAGASEQSPRDIGRDRALKSIIKNIKEGNISLGFQSLLGDWVLSKGGLVNMLKEVIKELKNGKTAAKVTYPATRLIEPFTKEEKWFDILKGWYQDARKKHISESSQQGLVSPYEAYPELTEEDRPVLRQAIFNNIEASLQASRSKMSPQAQLELDAYVQAFKLSQ